MNMKTCTKCHIDKPLQSFYKRKRSPSGHEAECKDCRKQRNSKWFNANRERHHEMMEQWYIDNKERHLDNSKIWYADNRERKLMTTNARDKRCKQATPTWADMDIIHYLYQQASKITLETGVPHEVDHIYPISSTKMCGLNVHWNMQIITAEQNRRKSNKIIHPQTF